MQKFELERTLRQTPPISIVLIILASALWLATCHPVNEYVPFSVADIVLDFN
jgi:hypothetical protein